MTQARILLCAAYLIACESSATAGPSARSATQVLPNVVTQQPQEADLQHDLVLAGTFEAFERAELYAQVTGYIASVAVDIGDEVKAGDTLARISVPKMRSDFRRAQAELDAAHAKVTRSREEAQLARLERERREGLRKKERSAIAQSDVDAASASEGIASADVAHARAEAETARAEISRLRTLKDFSSVQAPFSGRVVRRVLHPGALAREGTSSGAEPIVELVRDNPLRLVVHIPEALTTKVEAGFPLTVTVDALGVEPFEVEVSRSTDSLDPKTRTMRVEADVLNDGGRYKPGMYARVHATADLFSGMLVVPSAAVRGHGEDRFVHVVEGGVVAKKPVKVAFDDGRQAVLADGVSKSDAVVIAGSPLAEVGIAVEVSAS